MIIYNAELKDGLSELLSSQASIAYASIAAPSAKIPYKNKLEIKALAGIEDKDLYYTQSILVTTSWNKNDDIFDKAEVWAAKNTPVHKPTNLEHNEEIIVGHITSNWPIDEDGLLIDPSTPENQLPDKYHILTGSVIYAGYTDPILRDRASKLIAEIEDGTKYVSMECFFKGFDYGLINKSTGKYKILGRNEETAFLTKHLRAYGGIGEYQNHKIGRVLKEITFSGKGFVDKPANPESIIFTKNNLNFHNQIANFENSQEKIDNLVNTGVFFNRATLKENDMSLETEVVETKTEATSEHETKLVEVQAKASELENTVKTHEAAIAEMQTLLEQKEEAAKKMNEEMKKKDEEMTKVKSELESTLEVLAGYKAKEADMMKKEKKAKRMATLLEIGLDTELATSTVAKFEELDDASFENMTEVFAAMVPMKKKMAEEAGMMMKKKASEDEAANVEALETAEVENNIDLSVGTENAVSEIETTRAALVDFVYNRLGKKLNKGE